MNFTKICKIIHYNHLIKQGASLGEKSIPWNSKISEEYLDDRIVTLQKGEKVTKRFKKIPKA